MRPRLGFALSLLAACGIHAILLFVPRAGFIENVRIPTVELELTEIAGPPAHAARPAVVVTQPIGARASSRLGVPRQPEAQPAAPPAPAAPAAPAAAQPGSEPPAAAPGGQAETPASDEQAPGSQSGSETQSGSDNGGASSGPASAGSQAGGSTASFTAAVAVPTFIPPRPLSEILPKYPLSARRSGFEGVVRVSVLVDEKGSVTGVDVLSSSGHASLDQAVLDAYRHAQFAPALQEGKPVPGRVVIPVRFRLAAKPD